MKINSLKFLIIVCGIFVVSTVFAQTINESYINNKIDSVEKLIINRNYELKSLKSELLILKKDLDNYYIKKAGATSYICVLSTYLYKDESCFKRLCPIKNGEKIIVIEVKDKSYKAQYRSNYGYVIKNGFKKEEEVLNKKRVKEIEQKRKEEELKAQKEKAKIARIKREQQLKAKRKTDQLERKSYLIKKYGEKIGQKILEKKIWIGATKEMVKDSWGTPDDINRSVGSWGVHEQWVYRIGKYVYIKNGILESWQD